MTRREWEQLVQQYVNNQITSIQFRDGLLACGIPPLVAITLVETHDRDAVDKLLKQHISDYKETENQSRQNAE